ncbi:MAG TPA: radical SAM protein [Phycisphaerae bacterium]|nr:radical SAM protein [Phycisphaerae bacterium]
MELPRRNRGDELLRPGALIDLRRRIRNLSPAHDLVSVIACAFDHRTRMLPFIYADTRMAPAGVRAIGSALVDIGFDKTRIVLQQWNKHFDPSQMRLDGRIPDLFLVSTMGMHSGRAMQMIRDARRIPPEKRPLIIAGGSHAVYEPNLLFNADPATPGGADIVVTGEEYVFLSLLEVLLNTRAPGESLRSAFFRAKAAGALDDIPGLVYPRGDNDGIAEELVDTGIQQLLGNLDEIPHPVLGYKLLEAPSRSATLASQALASDRVRKHSPISSLILTFGCKFACPYCPIPAYNQRQHRLKSGERIADEMWQLYKNYGLRYFFGADDNFFNSKPRTLEIVETLARAEFEGVQLHRKARWYTEVTVHDTIQMKEHLPLIRKAGCRALWLGVEDMTATLVNKGQSVPKTIEAFQLMRNAGICPMPMMMHHDTQPLYSRGKNYGLLNQIKVLRKAGAVSLQVLMMTPSPGTKLYEGTFTSGLVLESVGGRRAEPYMYDGNYVVASKHPRPWKKQFNLLTAYLYFYNPVWAVVNLVKRKDGTGIKPAGMQLVGMCGLAHSIRRTFGWGLRLMFGKIERLSAPPQSSIPMQSPAGTCASHAPAPLELTISARPTAAIAVH